MEDKVNWYHPRKSYGAAKHSLLEAGTSRESFASVLEAALATLGHGIIGDLDTRKFANMGFQRPCQQQQIIWSCVQTNESAWNPELEAETVRRSKLDRLLHSCQEELWHRFPNYSHGIRAFIWSLSDYQRKDAFVLARLNIERLKWLLDSECHPTSLISPILEFPSLCKWLCRGIPLQFRNLARRVFTWIAWAHRPLSVQEMSFALLIYRHLPTSTSPPTAAEKVALTNLRHSIAEVCGGLVTVRDDQTVRFVHHDIRTCLVSDESRPDRPSCGIENQETIALTCLHLLTWHTRRQNQDLEALPALAATYLSSSGVSLLNYAHAHWAQHCRSAEKESYYLVGAIQEYLSVFLDHKRYRNLDDHNVSTSGSKGDWRNAILHECAIHGFIELAKTHLEMGADINGRDASGASPVSKALNSRHWSLASMLIERGASASFDLDVAGTDLLHQATACGRGDILAYLLQHGADPNVVTVSAETPLHWAAMSGRSDIVIELIYFGGDANQATVLTGETPLHFAALLGCAATLQNLLGFADVMARNYENWTALHYAAAYGHIRIAEILIEGGAEVNAVTSSGATPLALATEYGHESVISLLLSYSLHIAYTSYTKELWS